MFPFADVVDNYYVQVPTLAVSLCLEVAGLIVGCYLLFHVYPDESETKSTNEDESTPMTTATAKEVKTMTKMNKILAILTFFIGLMQVMKSAIPE
jgi:predicted histidine transporter YuiF (NhaC family)